MLAILLVLVILGSVTTAMANSKKANTCLACGVAKNSETELIDANTAVLLKAPEELTEEELQQIYKKYGITENDIKFAKGELPHYLEGTILDGSRKAVATEDGKLPKDLKEKNISCEVITIKEMFAIMEEARREYIKKYGVDPANPKVDVVNGVPLPREYVKELVKNGILSPETKKSEFAILSSECGSPYEGPHAIDGIIVARIVAANDELHKPTQSYKDETSQALDRFEENFGVVVYEYYWGFWDASDVSDWDNSSQVLDDLADDTAWLVKDENYIVIGWVDYLDHNGRAYPDGTWEGKFKPFCVCACKAEGWDWPHDSIVQHEVSHLFGAPEGGWWCWEHPPCIMNYCWAYLGYDGWCDGCKFCVAHNINPP